MTLDSLAALAIRTLQSTQWTDVGFSTITKQLATAMWPQLRGYLWQRYSPVIMGKYVNPLARRTIMPIAQRMGKTVVRKYGIPLARKTSKKIWSKAGEPMAQRFFPKFFTGNQEIIPDNQQSENISALNAKSPLENLPQILATKAPHSKRKQRKKAAKDKNKVIATPRQTVAIPAQPEYIPAPIIANETVSPEQVLIQNELPPTEKSKFSLGLFNNKGTLGNSGLFGNFMSSNQNNITNPTENAASPTPLHSRSNLLGRHMGMLPNRHNKQ